MTVGPDFNSAMLRTSRAFHAHLRPRLWDTIRFSSDERRLLAFGDSLFLMPADVQQQLRIRNLEFRLTEELRERLFLDNLISVLGPGSSLAVSLETLTVHITGPVDEEDVIADAETLSILAARCPGLRRFDICGQVESQFQTFFLRELGGQLAWGAPLAHLRNMTLRLPPEAVLFRRMLSDHPAGLRFKAVETLWAAPRRRKHARRLSSALLDFLLQLLEGLAAEQETLVLGPALLAHLGGEWCTGEDRLEIALAQRLVVDKADALDCRVVFPPDLDLGAALDADAQFQQVGLDEVLRLWDEGDWPVVD